MRCASSQYAAKAGVQPLIGALLPLRDEGQSGANGRPAPPALLPVLVQDGQGYQNLLKLLSRAYLGGEVGGAPELAAEDLTAHGGGLIALTGGPEGPVGKALLHGNRELAEAQLAHLEACFPGRLYVELMRHDLAAEDAIEPALVELALARDLPLVATNDVHFLEVEEFEAHDVLLSIADGAQVTQEHRRRLTPEHRLKTPAEMAELFADLPEAIANTLVIARRCSFMVPSRAPILPAFPTTGGRSEDEELRRQAEAGLDARLAAMVEPADDAAAYRSRLTYELDVIAGMKYAGYFLIVADFIQWAKARGIPVGPGRGSGAGLGGRLVARDHRPRPAPLRPAVRALPQPRARLDAGLRHRLLPGPARRGDQLRPGRSTARAGSPRSSPSASCRRAPCCATSAARSACPMARSTASPSSCRSTRRTRRRSSRPSCSSRGSPRRRARTSRSRA